MIKIRYTISNNIEVYKMCSMQIPNDLPNGHNMSYRKGFSEAINKDKRKKDQDKINIPNDLPNGHEKSYRRGFNDGKNTL